MIVTDPKAAAFLTNAELQRFITPFLGRVKSVNQVTLELGMKLNAVLYRTQQLEDYGLIKLDHSEARAGRAVRFYSAIAEAFFVPFRATPFESVQAQVQRIEQLHHQRFAQVLGMARQHQRSEEGWGTLLSRDEVGNVNIISTKLEPQTHNQLTGVLPISVWSSITLRPETAIVLAQRLQQILVEYLCQPAEENGTEYLLHVGLAKILEGKTAN